MCCGTAKIPCTPSSSTSTGRRDNGVDGKLALPVLGSDDDVADLTVDGDTLRLGDLVVPIAPGTGGGTGPEVHDRQHYRLIGWRRGVCGYRRFFAITSLAALRQEDRAVFDATHVQVRRWFTEQLVDGLRVDHPDGLSDPTGYLTWLRELSRTACVDRHREDPRRRRGAGPDAAGRRNHRLRRAARNRRPVRRSHRRTVAHRAVRFRGDSLLDDACAGPRTQGRGGDRHAVRANCADCAERS